MTTKIIELFDPTAKPVTLKMEIAQRVPDLNGKVVGFLNNEKASADIVLAKVEEELLKRYKLAGIIRVSKGPMGGAFAYPTDLSVDLTKKCAVVINGVGD